MPFFQEMPAWLAVGIGGFCGAIARFRISVLLSEWSRLKFGQVYPVGTLAVNVIGCLLIGVLMSLALEKRLSGDAQRLLVTGCLGSLTTFSTFGFDTISLIREDRPVLALAYVLANLVVGLLAVALGIWLTKLLVR